MLRNSSYIQKQLLKLGFQIGHNVLDNHYNNKLNSNFIRGIRNNYYIFNFNYTLFYLQKAIFFFKHLLKNPTNVLFYFSGLDDNSDMNLIIKLFLKKQLSLKLGWSFIYFKWVPGLITNYHLCFSRFVKLIAKKISGLRLSSSSSFRNRKKSRILKNLSNDKLFITLFLKLFFLLEEKMYLDETLDIGIEFKNISSLFRVILFLRFWKNFFCIPDLLCSLNPKQLDSPINEFNSLKIPVISVCDSNSYISNLSYPIPMNDDSLISVFFIVSLFTNLVKKSKIANY